MNISKNEGKYNIIIHIRLLHFVQQFIVLLPDLWKKIELLNLIMKWVPSFSFFYRVLSIRRAFLLVNNI